MQVVSPQLISGKDILLRLDLDVPLKEDRVMDEDRLMSGMDTLDLCLQYAKSVVIMGHIGRPNGIEVPDLSVKPIVEWFESQFAHINLPEGKLHILENLRFEPGEDALDPDFAKELASFGNFYINEAFASHHPATSTTLLPALLPHAAGLHFAKEVEKLLQIRSNPIKPMIAIIGGAKIEDKLEAIKTFSKIADQVLVGGKLPHEIEEKKITFPSNVVIAKMTPVGTDISEESIKGFVEILSQSKQVVWAGPMGYFEAGFQNGNQALAQEIIKSGGDAIVGGGDTTEALKLLGLLDKFSFISMGGGAMLELIAKGTLPTIEALS